MGNCSSNYDPCNTACNNIRGSYASASCQSAAKAAAYARQANTYATNAENSWLEFNALYLGAFAAAPTVDNEGDPLQVGALYWNSVSSELFAWNGTVWVATNFNEFTPFLATGTTATRNLVTRATDVLNAKDFGAVGDGVADDTAAIQVFFNSLTNGRSGFIPAGTYNISSPLILTITPRGFSLEGAGANATIFAATPLFSSTNPVLNIVTAGVPTGFSLGKFAVQNAGSSSLTGIRFGDESPSATVAVGYQFSNVHDIYCNAFQTLFDVVHFRQITFSRIAGWNPAFLTANTCLKIRQNGKFTTDLRFEDCQFVSSNNTGNYCVSIESLVGPYNILNGEKSVAGIKFRSCDFYAGEKAIKIYAANTAWITDIWFVDGCQIDQEVLNCIYVESDGSSTLINDLHFSGMFLNKATASQMDFSSTGSGGQIKNIFIDKCIFINGQSTGLNVFGPACTDFHVFENTFVDQNAPIGTCIEFNGPQNINVINNRATKGIFNNYSAFLATFSGSTSNFTAIGNDGRGVVSTSVINDVTGDVPKLVDYNPGFNPVGETLVTVGASPFSYKNTSGYTENIYIQGGTISNVNINGFNVEYTANGQLFALATGSTIVVTYTVVPAIYKRGI